MGPLSMGLPISDESLMIVPLSPEQVLPRKESSRMKNPNVFFSTNVKHGTRIKDKHLNITTIRVQRMFRKKHLQCD